MSSEFFMPGIFELVIIGAICAVPVLLGGLAIVVILAAVRKK